ncbi:MAG: hypothetical protein K8J08_11670 [Thermoanaerobaculia bacterium]|nr:hypothetical protein [Thermoanaerobaculia bacterium]
MHRGTVLAAGLLFDLTTHREEVAQERILAHWQPGSRVLEVEWKDEDGERLLCWFLHLGRPTMQRLVAWPATAVVERHDRLLCAAPLSDREVGRLEPVPGSLLIARGGRVFAFDLGQAKRLNPARWVDARALVLIEPIPPAARRTNLQATAPRLPSPELGQHIDRDFVSRSPEANRVLAGMQSRFEGSGTKHSKAATGIRSLVAMAINGPGAALVAGTAAVRSLFATGAGGSPPRSQGERRQSRWQRWTTQMLIRSRLSAVLGRHQARHFSRLASYFDRGELDQALRHAVPLGKPGGSLEPSWGLPKVRDQIRLSLSGIPTSGPGFLLEGNFFEYFKARYRQAAERLEREGKIEEAAFVYADLLSNANDAVALLERHQRYELAATLAEARQLKPGLVVRLLLLSGRKERAVQIARLRGVFGEAIAMLEPESPTLGSLLRVTWGDVLAGAGEYARAVEVLWPVESARRLARSFLDLGLEATLEGSHQATRLALLGLRLVPDRAPEFHFILSELLRDRSSSTAATRRSLALNLQKEKPPDETRDRWLELERLAVRSVLADELLNRDHSLVTRLVDNTEDVLLAYDARHLEGSQSPQSHEPFRYRVPVEASGDFPIFDSVALDGGRFLLALGEAGVRLVSRRGATLAHFRHPATHLVENTDGDTALGLIQRDVFWQIGAFDLVTRKARAWCDLDLQSFASTYDGQCWWVGRQGGLVVLGAPSATSRHDSRRSEPEVLWRVGNLPGEVTRLARGRKSLAVLITNAGQPPQIWRYELPGIVCRRRSTMPARAGQEHLALTPTGEYLGFSAGSDDIRELSLCSADELVESIAKSASWQACAANRVCIVGVGPSTSGGRRYLGVDVVWRRSARARSRIELEGSDNASIRLSERSLVLSDDRGRYLCFDLESCTIVAEGRVRG